MTDNTPQETPEEELARIKDGIKRHDTSLMIDGNDMQDYGWLTVEDVNSACRKRWGKGISEY